MALDIEKARPIPVFENGRPLCLVVGGTGRLGSAICRTLARDGARVAFTYHQNRSGAEALSKELGDAPYLACDARETSSVRSAISEARALGVLHALVIAAGMDASGEAQIDALEEREWEDLLALHVGGALRVCREVAPWLRESPGGNIVLLGSLAGVKPLPAPAHYAASKAALRGVVESLAKDLGEQGICANVISPGVLEEGLVERLCEENRRAYLKHCAFGRYGKAREVAEVAAWFALKNSYITAQAIALDGGL